MTRIIVDEILKSRLHDLKEPLELCDAAGHVLARVSPSVTAAELDLSKWEPVEPPTLTAEERERMLKEPTYTTAELIAYLEKL